MENPEANPMGLCYNPNPRALTWERLEKMRLKKIGLSNRYSRHLSEIIRMSQPPPNLSTQGRQKSFELSGSYQVESDLSKPESPPGALQAMKEARQPTTRKVSGKDAESRKNNSLAPFATLGKPTCGFFFSDGTNNRKVKFGIPPSNLVKWRNMPSQ